jgi:hypothetical protein
MTLPWKRQGRCASLALLAALGAASPAAAEEPAPEDKADLMHVLAAKGLHDLANERANLYVQASFVGGFHPGFRAAYTNAAPA